jgi:hypothetical protein
MAETPRLWSNGNRQQAQKIMQWLLAARVPATPEQAAGWPVDLGFDVALIELAESASPKLSKDEAWRLLDELSKTGGTSLDDFERLWSAGRGVTKASARKWRFWLPLQVAPGPGVRMPLAVSIFGTRFTLNTATPILNSLSKQLKKELRYRYHVSGHPDQHNPTTLVSFVAKGEEWRNAWDAGSAAWDTFRGLAEFAFGRGQLRIMGEGPRARFLHPGWLLARAVGQPLQFGEFVLDYQPRPRLGGDFTMTDEKVQRFRKLAAALRKESPKGSTLGIVADGLRLYAQAMDAGQPHGCLLGLWQLAEAVTLAEDSRGKTQKVVARLRLFTERWAPVGAARTLARLGAKRIALVHHGLHHIDEEEVNILLVVCESVLGWLMRVWKKLPTKLHLREFYRCVTRGDTELDAVTQSVAYIRAHRHRPEPKQPGRSEDGVGNLRRVIS